MARKVVDGKRGELSKQERQVLARYEKEKDERLKWKHFESISQKHWRQMSGRQTKVLKEQEERYGIPFGGATISLPAVVRTIHDFFADNKYKLASDDSLLAGGASPALEDYRRERAMMARLDRLEREGSLLPRDKVRQSLHKFAGIINNVGEVLQQQFGQSAADLHTNAIEQCEAEIERSFSEPDTGESEYDTCE